jgi:pyruvate dehydrogenase E1 component alpha subunit
MALHQQALHGAPCAVHAPRPHLQSAAFAGRPLPARRQRAHRQRVHAVAQTQAVVAKPSPAPAAPPKPAAKRSGGAADLTPEVASDLYRDMFLGREFEEKCAEMYYRGARPISGACCARAPSGPGPDSRPARAGKMFGFVHLYSGQEAVSTGVIRLLRGDDHICSTYRDHVHALSKNVPAREIMAELFGKKTGICRGQGGSMHMFSKKHNLVRCPRQ